MVGIYDALSKGVPIASGEFVHLLCADDWYTHRSVLSSVIAAMTAHANPWRPRSPWRPSQGDDSMARTKPTQRCSSRGGIADVMRRRNGPRRFGVFGVR